LERRWKSKSEKEGKEMRGCRGFFLVSCTVEIASAIKSGIGKPTALSSITHSLYGCMRGVTAAGGSFSSGHWTVTDEL
jgi:hypothetical protein